LTNSNFKNVKVGQRFTYSHATYVRIRPCAVEGKTYNAVLVKGARTHAMCGYYSFGNVAVSILEDDEG